MWGPSLTAETLPPSTSGRPQGIASTPTHVSFDLLRCRLESHAGGTGRTEGDGKKVIGNDTDGMCICVEETSLESVGSDMSKAGVVDEGGRVVASVGLSGD